MATATERLTRLRLGMLGEKSIAPPRWGSHLMMSLSGAINCWR